MVSPRTKPAPRALTELEANLAGTWVAHVGDDAPRSSTMAGGVMLGVPPGEKDIVSGVMKAVENDAKVSTSCEWLELYENLHGFRNECALIGGEAQALNKNDPFTGEVQPFGVAFTWRVEDKFVHLEYEAPLELPTASGSKKIRHITLELQAGGGAKHKLIQAFPEAPEIVARPVEYEILAGSYLGDPAN